MGTRRVIEVRDGVVVGTNPPLPRANVTTEQAYNKGYANGKKEALDQLAKAFEFCGVPIVSPTGPGDMAQQVVNLLRRAPTDANLTDDELLEVIGNRLHAAQKAREGEAAALQRVAKLKEVLGG